MAMKKIHIIVTIISVILAGCSFISCSGNNDDEVETTVTINDLPVQARDFLNKFYNGVKVAKIEKDNDKGIVVFEVELENGHEIVFNEEGVWQQVDAPSGESIPSGIAPQAIVDYLNLNYQGYGINEINLTGYGYKVELVTELDLMFNELGQFIGFLNED